LSSLFYDDFLKVNNQPQGLNTYNQMVRLVMGWYKKNKIQLLNDQNREPAASIQEK